MRALKHVVFVSGLTLVLVGLLFAENVSPLLEKSAAGGGGDSRKADAAPVDSSRRIERVIELEKQVAALQAKCEGLESRLGRHVNGLQERLEAVEGHHSKTKAQIVRFQNAQMERKLNPTEHKQTSELIQKRVFAAQNQWFQTLRAQAVQPVCPPLHEEPLYAP